MYHVVVGVDEDEAHAAQCAEEVLSLPGDAAETQVTLVHGHADSPASASTTPPAPVREAADRFDAAGVACDVTGCPVATPRRRSSTSRTRPTPT
jgi:hypothetical protein